jgi:hypothetical protein
MYLTTNLQKPFFYSAWRIRECTGPKSFQSAWGWGLFPSLSSTIPLPNHRFQPLLMHNNIFSKCYFSSTFLTNCPFFFIIVVSRMYYNLALDLTNLIRLHKCTCMNSLTGWCNMFILLSTVLHLIKLLLAVLQSVIRKDEPKASS